jgi:ABC-type multidrug transport system fused ATPase/permease subunit
MKSSFFNFNIIYNNLMLQQTEVESVDYIIEEKIINKIEDDKKNEKWNEISIKNLSFFYDSQSEMKNLDNINISIKNKSKIAFI